MASNGSASGTISKGSIRLHLWTTAPSTSGNVRVHAGARTNSSVNVLVNYKEQISFYKTINPDGLVMMPARRASAIDFIADQHPGWNRINASLNKT